MSEWPRWRLWKLTGGAFGLLILTLAAAPSLARADCGNHPFRLPGAEPFLFAHTADLKPEAPLPLPVKPLAPSKPCDGPQCSRNSSAPLLPVPVTPPSTDPWAVIATGPGSTGDDSLAHFLEGPGEKPGRNPSSIFHPPRPV